jgi:N-acetylglucosaminyl-diphospho-decaprenol L-rhamnosyltransferase
MHQSNGPFPDWLGPMLDKRAQVNHPMSAIDVVIAIVTYRSADLTINCLRSIAAEGSDGLRVRVIVVDNASGDGPLIAKAIEANDWSSWITVIEAPRNGGFAYGNNRAFEYAYERGPPAYFHVLNPDTVVRQGAIGALVRFLEAHPEAGIAGGRFEIPDSSEWTIAFRFPSIMSELEQGLQLGVASRVLRRWLPSKQMSAAPERTDWVSGASLMIRRAVIDEIGGFDENYFLYFEEIDLCFRAKKAGFSTWYVPDSRVMHMVGQSTKVKVMERNARPKQLPAYWFESRRRYFTVTYGVQYAMAADLVALMAHGLGFLKHVVQRQPDRRVPRFWADLAHHSVLWPKNRKVAAIKHFMPRYRGYELPQGG